MISSIYADRPRDGSNFFSFRSPTSAAEALESAELKRLNLSLSEVIDEELKVWTRSAPADLYYERDPENPRVVSFNIFDLFREKNPGNAKSASQKGPKKQKNLQTLT